MSLVNILCYSGTNKERSRTLRVFNGKREVEFKRDEFNNRGGPKGPTREDLRNCVLDWVRENDQEYLKNELKSLFDSEDWILIYTPPGMPQWQPIETVWTISKGYVRRKYTHCEQNYEKMRCDLVCGFYGDEHGYPGVTPGRVRKLTLECEKLMLAWLNETTKSSYSNLKDYKNEESIVKEDTLEEFQFNNDLELFEVIEEQETRGYLPLLDDPSSDEELL